MRYRPSFLLKPTACWGTGGAGAELVGLDQDAGGELEAREARREARVVLYPRRGARLSAQCHRLEGEGGEALRGPVDRRTKTRWTGPHTTRS
jgi:hypothetical protein